MYRSQKSLHLSLSKVHGTGIFYCLGFPSYVEAWHKFIESKTTPSCTLDLFLEFWNFEVKWRAYNQALISAMGTPFLLGSSHPMGYGQESKSQVGTALISFVFFFWWLFFYLGSFIYLLGSNWYFKQNFVEKLFILSVLKCIRLNMFIVFFWFFYIVTYIFFFIPLHSSMISFFFKLFIYLAPVGLSCGMQDLVSRPVIKAGPPALGAQSLSHGPPAKSSGAQSWIWTLTVQEEFQEEISPQPQNRCCNKLRQKGDSQ